MSDQTPPPAAPPAAAPLSEADDKQWAALSHLGGILGFIPPLVIWLIFKDRGHKTNVNGKAALNFQLTLLIAEIVGYILTFVLIGFLIVLAVYVVRLIFAILGFVKVNGGEEFKYPFAIPFIK